MIQSFNLLSGYQSIVGTALYHIPMLIAMLLYIRVPSEEELELAFPQESWLVNLWYYFCLVLHGLLTFVSMFDLFQFVAIDVLNWFSEFDGFMHLVQVLSQLARLLAMINLCIMMHLFGNSQIEGKEYSPQVEGFLIWMFFEIMMIVSTILVTMMFLLKRSVDRISY